MIEAAGLDFGCLPQMLGAKPGSAREANPNGRAWKPDI